MIFWFLAWAFLSLLFLYFWSAFKDRERRLLAAYFRGESRYRRIMNEFGDSRHGYVDPALNDHHLTVWERLPLYDWEAEGHL